MSFEAVAGIIGLFLPGTGLILAAREIRKSEKIARGEFLLHLDGMLQQHNQVHISLRTGGDYESGKRKPENAEDWAAIEQYMGLFERIKVLIDDNIIDLDTIDRLYGYRVFNIVDNADIRQAKLEEEAKSWSGFIALWHALEKKHEQQ